jgi:FixJ family two-component response regulator
MNTTDTPASPLVYVVDDDSSVVVAIADLLSTIGLVVKTFASASDLLAALQTIERKPGECPSCLILDVRMPGISGLEAQDHIAELNASVPIIFMTGHGDVAMTVKAMKAGAHDFLSKPFRGEDLLDAVRSALAHNQIHRERERVYRDLSERYASLTPHERKLLTMVTGGLMNKQIAAEMNLSEITIKVHRGQLMRKMKATTLVELVKMDTRLKTMERQ